MSEHKFNILIVDDEPKNIKLIASFLGVVKDYTISYSVDPIKALDMIRNQKYNLILLDINMPGVDGFQVCKKLKSHPETKDIPVIFLTAMIDDKSMQKAFSLGAADYITKPIKKIELVSRVKSIFAFEKYQKEIEDLKENVKFLALINKESIDAVPNPIIFYDESKMFMGNKALLSLLKYKSVEEFLENKKTILNLIYDSNCRASELNDIEWLEMLANAKEDDVNRISLRGPDELKHFIVNVLKLKNEKLTQYIIAFTEINKPNFTFTQELK